VTVGIVPRVEGAARRLDIEAVCLHPARQRQLRATEEAPSGP
jgi:hypothetical protein